jgi:PAS domain S-box-containing protein
VATHHPSTGLADPAPLPGEAVAPARDHERTYRSLFEHMRNGVALCRMIFDGDRPVDWIYLEVNEAFAAQTGLVGVAGKRVSEVVPGIREADPELFERYGRVARTGEPDRFEIFLHALDQWFAVSVYSTERDHFVAIFDVITERKRAEAALRASEERLRLFVEHAPASVAMFDRSMRFLAVSRRYARDRHAEMTELIGQSLYEAFPSTVRWREIHQRCLAGAVEQHDDDVFILRDGVVEPFRWELRPWHDATGAIGGVVLFSELLGEKQRAEAALRASEERYRALVDNMDSVVFTTDVEGRITFVNRAMTIFGFEPEQVIGRHRDEFVHPDDIAAARRARAEQVARGEPQPIEYRMIDASGKPRHVRSSARPLVVGDRVVGSTGVIADLTAQRRAEEQLREAQKMEAVGRLAGGVAHDFNNVLSVILSYTDMAVHALHAADPLRADLEEVLQAAKRAEGLTRQLLAFSRRQILTPEPIDLGQLVETVAKMLRRLIGEDIELEVRAARPLAMIKADRGQLEQVLMNLAVNARDAMPEGGRLTIEITNEALDPEAALALEVPPGAYVALTIADTGCGMDEATRAQAFEPFFTTKDVGKGTGLGLSMVYGIVRQSGGGISLASTPGAGATFRIFLPQHAEPARREAAAPALVQRPSGLERILVVDDEPAVLNVVRRSLAASGYDVLVAPNAAEALKLCAQHGDSLRLVLTDVVMPGMGGRELAAKLAPLCPNARMLFMSGYTDDDLARRGVLGNAFLRKPFDRQTLVAKVRSVLDGA